MKYKYALALAILVFTTSLLEASIRYYPRIIYIDADTKYKSIFLENESGKDNLYKLYFGYTEVSKKSRFTAIDKKHIKPEHRSFCENLKVFPKKIKLKAGEKQKIRITLKNFDKDSYKEGEYYCRIYAKALPKPVKLSNNIKGVKTQLNIVLTVGAPIHVIVNKNIKLDLKAQPYGYRIKNNHIYYKVVLNNKSTVGVRGTLTLTLFNTRTGQKVATFGQGFINQGKTTEVFLKGNLKDLDFSKNSYNAKITLSDSPGVDLDFHQFEYDGIVLEEFEVKK
jgi:hypothetical protein